MGRIGIPELMILLVLSVLWVVVIWPASRICKRVGFSPWLGLLAIIPVANVALLWIVAFSRWPRVQADPDRPPVDAILI